MEVTTFAILILMHFDSSEACEAYAQNLKNHQNCVPIVRYERLNKEPLGRPEIIGRIKI